MCRGEVAPAFWPLDRDAPDGEAAAHAPGEARAGGDADLTPGESRMLAILDGGGGAASVSLVPHRARCLRCLFPGAQRRNIYS